MDKGYILEPPVVRWICHLCGKIDITKEARMHTRMHHCDFLGLTVAMQDERTACKVEVKERDDYIGNEIVQTNTEGRPVMAVKTTFDDHEDIVVYAPTSVGESGLK